MPQLNNAWVMDDAKRRAFWGTVNDLGLSEEEAREALGLGPDENGEYASTKSYSGTLDDAMDAIAHYANDKRTADVDTEGLPEAPVVMYSQYMTPGGYECNFTIRAKTWGEARDQFAAACADIKYSGGRPLLRSQYQEAVTAKAAPASESSSPKSASSPSRESAPQSESGDGYTAVQWGNVNSITITADGDMELDASNRKWPLKHSHKAPTKAADLFSQGCFTESFAPIHLSQPGVYQPQGLKVKSGQNERGFWDVIEVRRA